MTFGELFGRFSMKTRYLITTILVYIITLCISTVYTQHSLASGYRITTDHHGIDVIIGETVTAWTDTTDLTTCEVTFTWKWNDNETPKRTTDVTEYITWYTGVDGWPEEPGVPHGTEVRRFTNSYSPDELGDWAVKATFLNSYGQTLASDNDSFPVKATSFHSIPEVPIGTIAIVLIMFGSLGLFAIRRRKTPLPT